MAALSWRFVEEPIRRGALGRIWARTRSWAWRRKAVPRQAVPRRIYRRQRRQRIATGIVSIAALSVLALDGAGLAGVIGSGAEVGSGSQPPYASAPEEIKLSTPRTSCYSRHSPTRTTKSPKAASTNTDSQKAASHKPESQKATPATLTSCEAVVYIGDSTSEGMVMPSYLPDPDLRLNAQLARVGAPPSTSRSRVRGRPSRRYRARPTPTT